MNLYFISIALTVASNVAYHLALKGLSPSVPPITALAATYLVSLFMSVAMTIFVPGLNAGTTLGQISLAQLGWIPFLLGIALPGLELGFLLAYRAGWPVSRAALVSNVTVTLVLVPVGLWFFREHITLMRIAGMALALVGLALISSG